MSTDSKSSLVHIELLNRCGASARDCPADFFYLQLSGYDIAPPFPFSSETILRLHRDPLLNRKLDTDYNIFVIDQNGDDQRVDGLEEHDLPANSQISLFRGQVVSGYSNSTANLAATSDPRSTILATGYIDPKTGRISLQAFIRYHDNLLYLRPNSGNVHRDSNLHIVSNENSSMGTSFFDMFQKQFMLRNKLQKRNAGDEVEKSCRKFCLFWFEIGLIVTSFSSQQ